MVDYVDTGLSANSVPYLTALAQQREVHAAVASGRAPDTVILLEHPSVYTAGKRTEDSERPTDGTPVIDVDRGGKITWHGPGQLVGYPIVRLADPIDVVAYVRRLEGMLIDVLAEFGIPGERVEGRSGVWLARHGQDRAPSASASPTASRCTASPSTARTRSPPTTRSSPAASPTPASPASAGSWAARSPRPTSPRSSAAHFESAMAGSLASAQEVRA